MREQGSPIFVTSQCASLLWLVEWAKVVSVLIELTQLRMTRLVTRHMHRGWAGPPLGSGIAKNCPAPVVAGHESHWSPLMATVCY